MASMIAEAFGPVQLPQDFPGVFLYKESVVDNRISRLLSTYQETPSLFFHCSIVAQVNPNQRKEHLWITVGHHPHLQSAR